MLTVAVGHSIDPDAPEAVAEALEQCQGTLAGQIPQAGIVFAAIDFEHQTILDEILRVFPELELVGCTADGELSSEMGFQQDSLTLMLFCSDEVEIRATVGRDVSQAPTDIAQAMVRSLKDQMQSPIRLCLAFPDGLRTNASTLVNSLQSELGPVPLLGGVAAEQPKAQQTYQFYRNEVLQDALPLLVFGGSLILSHGFASGWKPLGKRGVVTEVQDNILYRIDHQPALAFYQHYFENYSPDAAYPLAVFAPGEEKFFIRGSVSYDPEQGSLTMGGNVPLGATVQITDAERDDIVNAAKQSLEQAWSTYPGVAPAAALFFSCAWRRWVLGTHTDREYEAIAYTPGRDRIPTCGFYTFGEIAPLHDHGAAVNHNTTFVTLLLGTH